MADPARPAAAVRLTRPYANEDQFIEGDLDCIGRSWFVLPNVAARPVGDLLRFELTLENGASVVRAEGRVVAHREEADAERPAGLEVKLTRMDAKTKMLLDRAAARKATRGRAPMFSLAETAEVTGSDLRVPATVTEPPAAAEPPRSERAEPPRSERAEPPRSERAEPPRSERGSDRPSEPSGVHLRAGAAPVPPPANREEILARLRARAKALASTTITARKTGERSR